MTVYDRLEQLEIIGIKLGLENIRTLLAALGNPQNSFRSILIAGTNGKGSVGAMLHSILVANGYRSGHYTSPHLVHVRERFKVDDAIISEDHFQSLLENLFLRIDRLLVTGELKHLPTYFETLTAAAFAYFAQQNVEYAVVEVGLGGRFDATNVLQQHISVITSIHYDHEEFLGTSLSLIAEEKAGIIKEGGDVVAGLLPEPAYEVIAKKSLEKNCRFRSVRAHHITELRMENGFPVFHYNPWDANVRVNLRGRFQAQNAATALQTCMVFSERYAPLQKEKCIETLNRVVWPGRIDLIQTSPPVLLDCAHNPSGVSALSFALEDMAWEKVIGLFTAMKDKKVERMLQNIAGRMESLILTRVRPFERCSTMERLTAAAQSSGISFQTQPDFRQAYNQAETLSEKMSLPIVIFGSIYLAGEVLKLRS